MMLTLLDHTSLAHTQLKYWSVLAEFKHISVCWWNFPSPVFLVYLGFPNVYDGVF